MTPKNIKRLPFSNTNFERITISSFVIISMLASVLFIMNACSKDRPPALITNEAIDVTHTSATLGGKITNAGNPEYTERGVCYSTKENPETDDNKMQVEGTGTGDFSVEVSGLIPDTTYYVRAYVISVLGRIYGNEISFTTYTAFPAEITTNEATDITSSTATLGGNIINAGTPEYTERGVCYATTMNPVTDNYKMSVEGTGTGNFTATVSGLNENTIYYARAYLINAWGTVYGEMVSFKTFSSLNPEMIFVEGGTFMMGSPDNVGKGNERPAHRVTLGGFRIGKYPVTQGLWETVMGSNPSLFLNGDYYPVETVSWDDVQGFISKLNEITGKNYRLPTEAEWEYAARGGNKSNGYTYSGSNDIDDVAWYGIDSGGSTYPVGEKQPNELGIYDMSGNVFEWCSDFYGQYMADEQTNPEGPASGSERILRGGGWMSDTDFCRSAYRESYNPASNYSDIGFRLVTE